MSGVESRVFCARCRALSSPPLRCIRPIAIAIVAPIYEHDDMAHTYKPMIIKLLYGGIMALITNPIMALMAMGAESSVRRCYPELPIWHGERDAEISSAEQGMIERRDSEAVTRRNSMVTAANTPRGGGSAASSTHDLSSPTSPRMHGHTHEHSNGQGRPRAYTPIYEEPNAMPPTPAAVAANGEPSGPPVRSLPVPYVHGAPEPAHVDPSASAQA